MKLFSQRLNPTRVISTFALGLLATCLSGAPAQSPEAGMIDDCLYPSETEAQSVWEPMAGSRGAQVGSVQGTKGLRLSCNFANTKTERASWDRKVKLNLAACRGIRFELYCQNAKPVSYFSIYFQSGAGWYQASFYPETATGWNTVVIDKTEMHAEGTPAGWGQIKTIRISAWRGTDVDTEFYVRGLKKTGELGVDAEVAIVRAESVMGTSSGEQRSVEQFTEGMAANLRSLGIGWSVLSDLDLPPHLLAKAKLVILPYNPQMPDTAVDALGRYLEHGGKMLAFYSVPEKLRRTLNLTAAQHLKPEYPSQFSEIRFPGGMLAGAPPVVRQNSWNINAFRPLSSASRVLAEWYDGKGTNTGHPAVLASSNSIVMTHVLLADDATNKSRMLLAMIGSLVPGVWHEAAQLRIQQIGTLAGYKTYDQAVTGIAAGRQSARLTSTLEAVRNSRESAIRLVSEKKYPEAVEQATLAAERLTEAYCLAQQPAPAEFRAFWCHSAFGVNGMKWDEAIQRLATNGFTAVLPNMLWGGVAFYHSKVLPVAPEVAKRGDQVAECLAACRKYGIALHVWKVNWNLGSATPKEFVERMRREGRLQADAQGKEEPWLCPTHPANQELEIASMVELVHNYDLDGIHFDYIRFPDAEHCYCKGCEQRFRRATEGVLKQWPKDVLPEGPLHQRWLDWRRQAITTVVKAVSEQAQVIRPRIKVSAAVFPNWSHDRDAIGQDWKLWCDRGYLDFVCPMDYTPIVPSFDNMVSQQVEWAGKVPCYPGIGVSASSSAFGVDRVIEQIKITRSHRTGGFVIFNYGVPESRQLLPLLGLGITSKP